MSDSKIVSTEEMNEILKASKDDKLDLTQLIGSNAYIVDNQSKNFSPKALSNLTDLTWTECRNQYSQFTRRKMLFNLQQNEIANFGEILKDRQDKRIYVVAKLLPHNYYTLIVLDTNFLHQIINILFGGDYNESDVVNDTPGKISLAVAEKLSCLVLDSFVTACREHGDIRYEIVKVVNLPNLITKFKEDQPLYYLNMEVVLGTMIAEINFMVDINFLFDVIPATEEVAPPTTKQHWKESIKSQVVDSFVTLAVTLPNIEVNLKDFLEMTEDALITISDPRAVYIGLNNIKIFRANAGQLNDIRVVEVEREI